jgi:hypothetical protein
MANLHNNQRIRDLRRRPKTNHRAYVKDGTATLYTTTSAWGKNDKGEHVRLPHIHLERRHV